jgi:hypothetical protein
MPGPRRQLSESLILCLLDDVHMKTLLGIVVAFLAVSVVGQTVPIFTADYYRVNPENYVGKEVTLSVAYVMPWDRPRQDGMQELRANTYNQNRFGGHISIVASPEVAKRVAQQCGVQHVWDHSHITLIRGVFKKDEADPGQYYVFVTK